MDTHRPNVSSRRRRRRRVVARVPFLQHRFRAEKLALLYALRGRKCASLKTGAIWSYEAIAFYLGTPDGSGNCPAGATRIYRLYNNGITGAPNHRYTADAGVVTLIKAQGWDPRRRRRDRGVRLRARGRRWGLEYSRETVELNPRRALSHDSGRSGQSPRKAPRPSCSRGRCPSSRATCSSFRKTASSARFPCRHSGNTTTVTVATPTLDEVFAQLQVAGTIGLDSLVLAGSGARGGFGACRIRRCRCLVRGPGCFTVEPKFSMAFDSKNNAGVKVAGSTCSPNAPTTRTRSSKYSRFLWSIYGPLDVKIDKAKMAEAGVRNYRLKFDGAVSVGRQDCDSREVGENRRNSRLPLAGLPLLRLRVPITLGARARDRLVPGESCWPRQRRTSSCPPPRTRIPPARSRTSRPSTSSCRARPRVRRSRLPGAATSTSRCKSRRSGTSSLRRAAPRSGRRST